MKKLPLEREALLPRIDGIRKNIKKLESLAKLPQEEFESSDAFDLAQHHLRLALEGVFHIATHILSRLAGGRATEYKEIARKMGELKIVPMDFAKQKLVPMAGMRNILVHVYADLDPKKLHAIIRNHTIDIEEFLKHVGELIANPSAFDLTIE